MTAKFLRQGPRWFMVLAGFAIFIVFAAWFGEAPAQTKKGNPADDTKKDVDPPGKKDGKKDPRKEFVYKPPTIKDVMVSTAGGVEQVGMINEHLEKGWKDNKIYPSDRCTDYEFIRRASLDIIGRIAKVHEIDRFLKDPPDRRRSLLIERLLGNEKGGEAYADEYASNWANLWTVMLLTRTGSGKLAQEQMREWLTSQFKGQFESSADKTPKAADWSKIVVDLIAAVGKTSDVDVAKENPAVNFVLHHLGDEIKQDVRANGKYEMVPITSRTTRLFMGLRTQCVQCHDHPFNGEWQQHHFWGINAFFRQVDPTGRPDMMAKKKKKGEGTQRYALSDNPDYNVKGLVPYERRSGVLLYTKATFLDGTKMGEVGKDTTRRKELAKLIVKSPYFAKVTVNRAWAHFFGLSFTKIAPDDFGEHNLPSHPELLDHLSKDWAEKYNHDPKQLIRWICNSRAYGLSSIANPTNDKPEDETFFPRMLMKSMTPEQLFESLMVATQAKVGQSKETRIELKQDWLDKLVVNFGDDEGNEGSFNGTVVQALMLMNGQDLNTAVMDKDNGTVSAVIKKYANKGEAVYRLAMRDLYLAALNRPPTDAEYKRVLNPKMFNLPKSGPVRDQSAFWTGFYQDMFWACLNSSEFILNH